MLAAVALLASATLAQPLTPAVKARVDKVFAEYDKPGSPGCALGIIRDGKLIHSRGYGYANLDHAIPITADTVFDIGTASKAFTATAVLLLEQDGKLKLEDDIRKYIPELPDYGTPITIRQMLKHTSGLRDYLTLFSLALYGPEDYYSADEALAMLARQKALVFKPDTDKWDFQSGYFLMSILVKRVSGKTLTQFAHERMFQPLGMTNTRFHDNHKEPVARRATGYRPRANAKGFDILMNTADTIGDRGLHTSINDLLKWDRSLYTLKTDPKFGLHAFPFQGLAAVAYRAPWEYWVGLIAPTLPWSLRGFRSDLLRFPTERTSIYCLCNHAGTEPDGYTERVAEIILESKLSGPQLGRPGAIGDQRPWPKGTSQ